MAAPLSALPAFRPVSTDIVGANLWSYLSGAEKDRDGPKVADEALQLLAMMEACRSQPHQPQAAAAAAAEPQYTLVSESHEYKILSVPENLPKRLKNPLYALVQRSVLQREKNLVLFPKFNWAQIALDLDNQRRTVLAGSMESAASFRGVQLYPSVGQLRDNLLFASVLTCLMPQQDSGLRKIYALLVSYADSGAAAPRLISVTQNSRSAHDGARAHSLCHAEYLLIQEAILSFKILPDQLRQHYALYTSLQPCAQCAGVIGLATVRAVYFLYRDCSWALSNIAVTFSDHQTLFINLFERLLCIGLPYAYLARYVKLTGSGKTGLSNSSATDLTLDITEFAESYFTGDDAVRQQVVLADAKVLLGCKSLFTFTVPNISSHIFGKWDEHNVNLLLDSLLHSTQVAMASTEGVMFSCAQQLTDEQLVPDIFRTAFCQAMSTKRQQLTQPSFIFARPSPHFEICSRRDMHDTPTILFRIELLENPPALSPAPTPVLAPAPTSAPAPASATATDVPEVSNADSIAESSGGQSVLDEMGAASPTPSTTPRLTGSRVPSAQDSRMNFGTELTATAAATPTAIPVSSPPAVGGEPAS